MSNIIQLQKITKEYGNKTVLNDINLSITSNQVIALLGGNGTGKSTLLQIIAGIEKPSSGNIKYASNGMVIGFVPERFPKSLRFSPIEYLSYMGSMAGIPKATLESKLKNLLQRFQLEQFRDIRIHDLSKGNIQKVGIIQALLNSPDILILDEPLSGLDREAQETLIETIKELREEGSTIILTYHEANLLEPVVDQTYFIVDGKLSGSKHDEGLRKLLIIKSINKSLVKDWEGILQLEEREDQLYLEVSHQHSDEILYKILEQNGSVESVSTLGSMEEGVE